MARLLDRDLGCDCAAACSRLMPPATMFKDSPLRLKASAIIAQACSAYAPASGCHQIHRRISRYAKASGGISKFGLRQGMRAADRRGRMILDRDLSEAQLGETALSVLVPVYNERRTVEQTLRRLLEVPFPQTIEVIVVDDGSTDGSTEVLHGLSSLSGVQVLTHPRNSGKGAAIQTALRHARGKFMVIQDADEELDPNDLLPMFERVRSGEASVCYGSRFLGDTGRFRLRPIYLANRLLNKLCNLLNGLQLTDMNTCYKMMRTDIARRLNLSSRGFAMEPEITTKLARMGIDIIEHAISYRPRARAEGKKIRAMDFFRYLAAMVRFRFERPSYFPIPSQLIAARVDGQF